MTRLARHRAYRPGATLGRIGKWIGITIVVLVGGTMAALGALVTSLGLLWFAAGLISHLP